MTRGYHDHTLRFDVNNNRPSLLLLNTTCENTVALESRSLQVQSYLPLLPKNNKYPPLDKYHQR